MSTPAWFKSPPKPPGAHTSELDAGSAAFKTGASHCREAQAAIQKVIDSGLKDWQGTARDQAMVRLQKLAAYVGQVAASWESASGALSTLSGKLNDAAIEWNTSNSTYEPYEPFGGTPSLGGLPVYRLDEDGTVERGVQSFLPPLKPNPPHTSPTPSRSPTVPPIQAGPTAPTWTPVLSGSEAWLGKRGFVHSGPDALAAQQAAETTFTGLETGPDSLRGLANYNPGTPLSVPTGAGAEHDSKLPWFGAVVVQPGDNLWNITAALTGNGAGYGAIYARNRGVIGSNPNDLQPGQVLSLGPGDSAAIQNGKVPTENPDTVLGKTPNDPIPSTEPTGSGPGAPTGWTSSDGTKGTAQSVVHAAVVELALGQSSTVSILGPDGQTYYLQHVPSTDLNAVGSQYAYALTTGPIVGATPTTISATGPDAAVTELLKHVR